jgi:hypothetical protein
MEQDNKTDITHRKGHKRSPASPASPAQRARRPSNRRSLTVGACLVKGFNGNPAQCRPSPRPRPYALSTLNPHGPI